MSTGYLIYFRLLLNKLEPAHLGMAFLGFSLFVGSFIGFWLALHPLVRYCSAWIVLRCQRKIPLRFDLFLKYVVERKLMQNIDGRYRFIHQLLHEHFAPQSSSTYSSPYLHASVFDSPF